MFSAFFAQGKQTFCTDYRKIRIVRSVPKAALKAKFFNGCWVPEPDAHCMKVSGNLRPDAVTHLATYFDRNTFDKITRRGWYFCKLVALTHSVGFRLLTSLFLSSLQCGNRGERPKWARDMNKGGDHSTNCTAPKYKLNRFYEIGVDVRMIDRPLEFMVSLP